MQATGERTFAQLVPTYEPGEPLEPADPADLGYEADGVGVLAAIDRADDPADRGSVVYAYFDGTERDSRLGRYRIGQAAGVRSPSVNRQVPQRRLSSSG